MIAIFATIRGFDRNATMAPGHTKLDLTYENDTSRIARFRRELRNPSMFTMILIVAVIVVAISAPFLGDWIDTSRSSFAAMRASKELNESTKSSISVIVPSQIAPWMASQSQTMIDAEGPLEWKAVSFRSGPCDPGNLSQLPASKYSDSIAQTCGTLDDIQQRYSGDCSRVTACEISSEAVNEIKAAMAVVWDAFSDAGFVLPYTAQEEQVLP